jgi:hypothetical protein
MILDTNGNAPDQKEVEAVLGTTDRVEDKVSRGTCSILKHTHRVRQV